ncbi:3-galactosyl-N-acetylglucosaminide 4-alpha-L-fucosyltransferase FUT3-like [Littorina saxatilis]|uniref:3-galactosyl-N-acetylglucosaminide 4-alpha-L-fucosyltransferase FUT3-like n=1 Tax=Littorina saxatilis TaxID=31220 RepID=UPI0038B54895
MSRRVSRNQLAALTLTGGSLIITYLLRYGPAYSDVTHHAPSPYLRVLEQESDVTHTGPQKFLSGGQQASSRNHQNSSRNQAPRGVPTYQNLSEQAQTSDNWPLFSKNYFPGPIPRSPFHPDVTITWDFNTSAFLQRHDVRGQPPKLMTWMVKTRYTPPLPEPVRLRVCPEMPCRMTTNTRYQDDSAALLWAAQIMTDPAPPPRSHPDQVYVFHNHESQQPPWIRHSSFRQPAWRSAFNWTMTYRADSDIQGVYGVMARRERPAEKNYTHILALKTRLAAQLVSSCHTFSRREEYVRRVDHIARVDKYGGCSKLKCPRHSDDACFKLLSTQYKFYFSFENAFCKDYITEKFFRFMEGDFVVVARGSNDYKAHAPSGTFINTADFRSPEHLARHLLYLDSHPEEYLKILRAKDRYRPLFEDWPIRTARGNILFMTYHYQAVGFCEMCRRLWDLDRYRHTVPDIAVWFDKHNCYPPPDLS